MTRSAKGVHADPGLHVRGELVDDRLADLDVDLNPVEIGDGDDLLALADRRALLDLRLIRAE